MEPECDRGGCKRKAERAAGESRVLSARGRVYERNDNRRPSKKNPKGESFSRSRVNQKRTCPVVQNKGDAEADCGDRR